MSKLIKNLNKVKKKKKKGSGVIKKVIYKTISIRDVKFKNTQYIQVKHIKKRKFYKLREFVASVRRRRPPFKFISYANKYAYKKYLPKYQFYLVHHNKKGKKVKGAITSKLYLKNLLEVIIALKKKLLKRKGKIKRFKKKGKKYRWRRKLGTNFRFKYRRRWGIIYVKKKKGRFKKKRRLNQRVYLIKKKKVSKLFKRRGKVFLIKRRKSRKNRLRILKFIKNQVNFKNKELKRRKILQGLPLRSYSKETRLSTKNLTTLISVVKKNLRVLKLFEVSKLNNFQFRKRFKFKFIRAMLPGLGRIEYEMYSTFATNVQKFIKKCTQSRKQNIILWKAVAKKFFNKAIQITIKHNNLNQFYKEKVKELQKNKYNIGIQRQKNNLKIITLQIAKKREKKGLSKNDEEKKTYIQNELTPLNQLSFMKVATKTKVEFIKSDYEFINKLSIIKSKKKITITILKTYLAKNKLRKKNRITSKLKTFGKRKFKSLVKRNKKIRRKKVYTKERKKKLKSKKINKISVEAFKLFIKNIKRAPVKIAKKLKKIKKKKQVKIKSKLKMVGLKAGRRIAKTSNIKVWRMKLYNGLKVTESVKRIHKKYFKRSVKIKVKKIKGKNFVKKEYIKRKIKGVAQDKVLLKKNNKKFKIEWLKKKEIKKFKKRPKKGKRGKKNTEKRKRISKVAYFIRPRIINQKEFHAYVTHCKQRVILANKLKVRKRKRKKITLIKKVYTKEKKQKIIKNIIKKHFGDQNTAIIINKLKTININNYLNNKGTRYLTSSVNLFIQDYIKHFYNLVAPKLLAKNLLDKKILQKVKKTKKLNKGLRLLFKNLSVKVKRSRVVRKKVKIEKLNKWVRLQSVSRFYGRKQIKKKRVKRKFRKVALRNLIKGRVATKMASRWSLKKSERLLVEALRRRGIKGPQTKFYYFYKKKKTRITRSKFISRRILKAHKKAKKKGKKVKKNLIKASYYYYFKRLRYDRILFDKLNFKQKELKMAIKNKIKLSKFLLYLLMRVYVKKTQFKRTNVRKGLRKIKRLTKKQKITKKIKILGVLLESFTKPVRRRSKKYIGVIKKTVLIKVLIKLLRSLLKSTNGEKRERKQRNKIKEIIKIFLYPLLINKRQIKKIRLRKKNKIYLIMAQIFLYNIKQIVQSNYYSINFFGIIGSNVTAEYVLRRLKERLENVKGKGTGFWLIPKAMKRLMNSKHIVGFKMKFSGRLTGNSMAQQSIMKKGIIGNSNMNVYIDYAQDNLIRKHGKCGIKLWIVRNLITYMPYKYVYTYNFKQ